MTHYKVPSLPKCSKCLHYNVCVFSIVIYTLLLQNVIADTMAIIVSYNVLVANTARAIKLTDHAIARHRVGRVIYATKVSVHGCFGIRRNMFGGQN